jgi:hypothetical protein
MTTLLDALKRNLEKTWFGFVAVLAICFLTVVLPIHLGGIKRLPDLQSYVNFAQAFGTAISAGDIFPGWTNDNLGFGTIGIRFYPPAASFIVALLEKLTGDWYNAFWISLFGWMLLGCFGVYLFVKEWGTPAQGILAALVYSIVPYHLAEVYRFFFYAQFAAGAVLPFCFLYLTRVCRRQNWSDILPLAISFSALILTHLPLTIITIFSLIIYVPIVMDWRNWRRASLQLLSSATITAAATSFYWIRLVTELDWLAHAEPKYTIAGAGHGPYPFPNSLMTGGDLWVYSHLFRHIDIMIVMTTALLVPFLLVLILGWKKVLGPEARVVIAVSSAAAFGIFMLLRPSEFLWSNLSILQRLQFPWRWLSVISFLAAASFTLSLPLLLKIKKLSERIILSGVVFLIIFFAAYDVRQISSAPFRIKSAEFNQLARDFQSEPTAVFWWPVWAREGALETRELVTAGDRGVLITDWQSERRKFTVGEGASTTLRVATFYYPYWHASVNGRAVDVGKDENGTITLPVGDERSEVDLRFEEPALYTATTWLSMALWIFLLGSLSSRLRRSNSADVATVENGAS